MMPMLSLLVSFALQGDIIGWHCSAERSIEGRVYRWRQAIEGQQRSTRELSVSPAQADEPADWIARASQLPDLSWSLSFSMPISRRTTRADLRILLPDGTERLLPNQLLIWSRSPRSSSPILGHLQGLPDELDRLLWAAGGARLVAQDRRGRVLGTLEVHLPDGAEAARIAGELERETDMKLRNPGDPANQCSPYGQEAYHDPV